MGLARERNKVWPTYISSHSLFSFAISTIRVKGKKRGERFSNVIMNLIVCLVKIRESKYIANLRTNVYLENNLNVLPANCTRSGGRKSQPAMIQGQLRVI